MFHTEVVQKIETHFMFNNVFPENPAVHEIMWKNYVQPGRATDDNMAHTHCMLDTQSYKHTFRIFNTYCFSTATIVARTRLTVTLYVHCLFS